MDHKAAGQTLTPRQLSPLRGPSAPLPDPDRIVHLQFLRFAGCPVCQLHLRQFVTRDQELRAAGIREVAVFHSSREALLKYESDLPFDVIPDPNRHLYQEFGVERSPRAVLDPRVWPSILRAAGAAIWAALRRRAPFSPLSPEGGQLGLPADLLIAPDGRILHVSYGRHANDQWSVDEVLALGSDPGAGSMNRA